MTSLSEAYGGNGETDLRRLYAGVGLFVAGTLALVTAIVITTTTVYVGGETTMTDARHLGGLLGGLGLPAMFLGVFAVLPSSRQTKAAALIGAAISVLGAGLFWHAYPCQWVGSNCGAGLVDLTLPTAGTYFLGTVTALWCLFAGVANFKKRNDPGGTARVTVTTKGETRVVEVDRDRGLGSLGVLGGTPDETVETQTGTDPTATAPKGGLGSGAGAGAGTGAGAGAGPGTGAGSGAGATDGGASTQTISSPIEQSSSPGSSLGSSPQSGASSIPDPSDRYCGNCTHFEYVRTDEGIQPYCGLRSELMADMDACEEWTPRN